MQYLTREGKTYKGRKGIAECMAKHQGAGERREEKKGKWRELEEVEEWEVQEAIKHSPVNSANGAEDAPIKMVQTAN